MKKYEAPEMEIVTFGMMDVITTSATEAPREDETPIN